MSKSNNTLTSVLVGSLRWSGKTSFWMFFIGLIIVGGATAYGDPTINYYQVDANTPSVLLEKYISSNDLQVGISVDNHKFVELVIYRVEFLTVNENNVTSTSNYRSSGAEPLRTEVFKIEAPEFFRDLNLEDGTYQFVVTSDQSVGLVFGEANYIPGTVVLASIFLVLFSIAISIFFTVLPFALFVLFVNAVSGSGDGRPRTKTVYVSPQTQGEPREERRQTRQAARVERHQERRARRAARPSVTVINPFENFTTNFTQKDWTAVTFGIIFLFLSFSGNGFFFFLFLALTVGTVYRVAEREKMKDRILVLLKHYPTTNLDFLTRQMGERRQKKVHDVLNIMILDDGMPIQYNLKNQMVTVVGDLSAFSEPEGTHTYPVPVEVVNQPTVAKTAPVTSAPVSASQPAPEPVEKPAFKPTGAFCTGCGEDLPNGIKYCPFCGQKS